MTRGILYNKKSSSKGAARTFTNLCTEGSGRYQEWGRGTRELYPGDAVEIPAGVKHWHGAAKGSWFSQLAVEIPGEGVSNEWLEGVTAEEYNALK